MRVYLKQIFIKNRKSNNKPLSPTDSKRARMSNETDQDTGSESSPSSPHQNNHSQHNHKNNYLGSLSPDRNGPPSSPESDLDVDSAPDDATPENLSLKKEDSTSPPNTPVENLHMLRNATNGQGFLPYHQHHTQFLTAAAVASHQQQQQRSPVDVLLRVFPNRRRSEVEQLLQRYRGDVVQAMEAMLSGEDMGPLVNVSPTSPPQFPLKSAFSPLVPPTVFGSPPNRYPFMQNHSKRFLSAPYSGTGYLTATITDLDQSESNERTSSNGESQD